MTTPATAVPPVRASRLDPWLTRRGLTGVTARDRLLAAVVATLTAVVLPAVLLLSSAGDEAPIGGGVVAAITAACVVQCLPLAVRRTRPVACLLLVAALQVVVAALTPEGTGARALAPVLAAYAAATVLPGRSTARLVAAAIGVELVGTVAVTAALGTLATGLAGVASAGVTYVAAALVGSDVRTRRRYVDLVRRRAAETVASQEARVAAAISGERTRMARELHDIAAHHLSGMVVQATATSRLVERDPAATREGLLAIRAQGRRTLEDLRLLVGVLRDPATAEDGAPVPGLAVLDGLLDEARALGADVRVERTGETVALGPLADVTAYRLVQEALSNARQHALGAPVVVALAQHPAHLVITVTNPAGGAPPEPRPDGVGVIGMRERVQLAGGRLEVGPTPDGGWAVRAELPTEPTGPAGPEEGDTT